MALVDPWSPIAGGTDASYSTVVGGLVLNGRSKSARRLCGRIAPVVKGVAGHGAAVDDGESRGGVEGPRE